MIANKINNFNIPNYARLSYPSEFPSRLFFIKEVEDLSDFREYSRILKEQFF